MPGMTERDQSTRAKEMLDQARKLPGVAEAMNVYQAAAKRAALPQPQAPTLRFSTGGNV